MVNEIIVKVQDSSGVLVWEFKAEKWKTISQMAEANQIDIPIACWAWACFVCAVKVLKWLDLVNWSLTSSPLIDLEEDQILTCIGWVKDEAFDKWENQEIVIQKIN